MITLYAFTPAFGLPGPGPFALKTEVHLQMMTLPYQTRFEGYAKAPKGKLPYIDDDGTLVADSTFIRFHLESKYSVDLDAGLSEIQRANVWAIERLVEDHLYWAMVHSRWGIDENFQKGPAHFFDHLPEGIQHEARQKQRAAVLGYLHGQGIGRHSPTQIGLLAQRGYHALAQLLGDKTYLAGDEPCGADASVFAQIASALSPWFESPVREAAAAHSNLVSYSNRMMAVYFPGFVKSATDPSAQLANTLIS
jgi:glutathione S-transferase